MKNLSTEHPLDKHLKPVKDSDGNNSSLEVSTEKVRVKDLEVTGTTTGISASDDTKLPLSGGTMTGDITLPNDGKVVFGDAEEYIKGDGSKLIISSTGFVDFNGARVIGASRFTFNDGGATADIVRDEDDMTSNDANALVTQQSVKSYVDNGAGRILAYRDIGLNEAEASYNMTTSYAVPTDEFGITFTAPTGGNVEYVIENIWVDYGGFGSGDFFIGLSTANATDGYIALASYHEKNIGDNEGRYAQNVSSVSWTLTGLTPGTSYTYYVGFKSSSTSGTPHISWGGDATGKSPDIIIKAIALPGTIST